MQTETAQSHILWDGTFSCGLHQADSATERERQLTTTRANQTTGLTNGRATNWAPEVEFSPFRALSRRQMTYPFCCLISLLGSFPTPPPAVLVLIPQHPQPLRCSINPQSDSYGVYVQERNSTCGVKRLAACSQSIKVRLITGSPFLLFLSPLSETRKTRK